MLCDAIEANDLEAVRRLVENGEDVDEIDFDHEAAPIEKVAEERNAEAVRLLLTLGASPNGAMISPALLVTNSNGDSRIVSLLLEGSWHRVMRSARYCPTTTWAPTGEIT